eukprot:CFRG4371T1
MTDRMVITSNYESRYVFQRDLQYGNVKPSNVVRRYCADKGLLQRMELNNTLVGHTGCVNSINWNSAGQLLLSGSDDCELIIWDFPSGRIRHQWTSGHHSNIFCAQFLPGDQKVVSGARDSQVWVHSIERTGGSYQNGDGHRLHRYECHTQDVKKIALDTNNVNVFMTCSEDGSVRLFDLRESHTCGRPCTSNIVVEHDREINGLSVNPNAPHLFVVAGGDKDVFVYDRRMLQWKSAAAPAVRRGSDGSGSASGFKTYTRCVSKFRAEGTNSHHVTGVRYSNTGREILASYSVDDIYMFDASGLQLRQFSLDGNSVSNDSSERKNSDNENDKQKRPGRKDYATCPFIRKFSGHCNIKTIKDVNFYGPDSEYVMSGSDDGRVYVWEKDSGQLVQFLEGDNDVVNQIIGHPTLPVIACSGIDDTIKIFEPTASDRVDVADAEVAMKRNKERVIESSRTGLPFLLSRDGSQGAVIRIGNIAVVLSDFPGLADVFTMRRRRSRAPVQTHSSDQHSEVSGTSDVDEYHTAEYGNTSDTAMQVDEGRQGNSDEVEEEQEEDVPFNARRVLEVLTAHIDESTSGHGRRYRADSPGV